MRRLIAALFFTSVALSGCATALSPADLKKNETHGYPGRTRAQLYRATVTSLRTLGYEVVVSDEPGGKIKTAPKLVTAVAHGNSYGAVPTEHSIAWSIDVTSKSDGAAVHAEPRGYSGGQAVPPSQMSGSYLLKLFSTLYGEIDTNLPASK